MMPSDIELIMMMSHVVRLAHNIGHGLFRSLALHSNICGINTTVHVGMEEWLLQAICSSVSVALTWLPICRSSSGIRFRRVPLSISDELCLSSRMAPRCFRCRSRELCHDHGHYRLVTQDKLHPSMWINQYVIKHYRPTNMSNGMCAKRWAPWFRIWFDDIDWLWNRNRFAWRYQQLHSVNHLQGLLCWQLIRCMIGFKKLNGSVLTEDRALESSRPPFLEQMMALFCWIISRF